MSAVGYTGGDPTKQPLDADLTAIAGLAPANDDMIQRKAAAWANRTLAQLKADLAINLVTNTADADKPVSTAQAAADALRALLTGAVFTGTVEIDEGTAFVIRNGASDGFRFQQFNTNGWQVVPLTAAGDIFKFGTNVEVEGSDLRVITAGKGLRIAEGGNAKMGVVTLVGGTATVATTAVLTNSRIFITCQSLGTITAPKARDITARVTGVSFTITSADATDTSVIAWHIIEPA